jgi:sulfur-carrier protein adenylyltransferase/sulfurtransferase
MPEASQVSVHELQAMRERGEPIVVLDVREPWEIAVAALPGSVCIPLGEIPDRLKELDAQSAIIVMCKSGGRSQVAANFLINQGFKSVFNLAGGITAWAREIDPKLPTY